MTRIDFHFNAEHRLHYACRVTRKARAAGKRLVVLARDSDRLAQFDMALWTFSALDFLPHVYVDSQLAASTPVLLTLDGARAPASDVLLTLDDEAPPDFEALFTRYERVIEVVSRNDDDRARARIRFKTYRDRGFEPTAFEVAGRE
ncbi:MAG TPA: DNA polymerase III subunit chi [Burkholderiaceae bacterium]|nr:DNA polymerase III subunit chi [Burkholderiaceae bacterium]HQR77728.1 DNA polymerase III subunit chi [Burkholderiaceae bacterium]